MITQVTSVTTSIGPEAHCAPAPSTPARTTFSFRKVFDRPKRVERDEAER
ncbi:hypothetical protein [Streptomyces sp. NPDC101455]